MGGIGRIWSGLVGMKSQPFVASGQKNGALRFCHLLMSFTVLRSVMPIQVVLFGELEGGNGSVKASQASWTINHAGKGEMGTL
jgi:hypothetical protein